MALSYKDFLKIEGDKMFQSLDPNAPANKRKYQNYLTETKKEKVKTSSPYDIPEWGISLKDIGYEYQEPMTAVTALDTIQEKGLQAAVDRERRKEATKEDIENLRYARKKGMIPAKQTPEEYYAEYIPKEEPTKEKTFIQHYSEALVEEFGEGIRKWREFVKPVVKFFEPENEEEALKMGMVKIGEVEGKDQYFDVVSSVMPMASISSRGKVAFTKIMKKGKPHIVKLAKRTLGKLVGETDVKKIQVLEKTLVNLSKGKAVGLPRLPTKPFAYTKEQLKKFTTPFIPDNIKETAIEAKAILKETSDRKFISETANALKTAKPTMLGKLKPVLKEEQIKLEFTSIKNYLGGKNIERIVKIGAENPYLTGAEREHLVIGLKNIIEGSIPGPKELELLADVYGDDFIKAISSRQSLFKTMKNIYYETINVPRAMMSSVDLSNPFRQGIFTAYKHPVMFAKGFKPMIKAAVSKKQYDGILKSIKDRPNYLKMKDHGLALTDVDKKLTSREEAFMSSLAEKIPLLGRIIAGSNRGFTTFANKLRADLFDYFIGLGKKVKTKDTKFNETKFLKSASNFINSATGRGDLTTFKDSAAGLNSFFFSPRLMKSRVNLLNPIYYARLEKGVRAEAIKSAVTFWAGSITILGLADSIPGVDVGKDPRSSDFGKIKIGNTRVDVLGGFQQYIRLATQLWTKEVVSVKTGAVIKLGEGYRALTREDIIINFLRNKEAPIASFITGQFLTGKDFTGKEFNTIQETINRFVPMIIQDTIDLVKEGDSELLFLLVPAVFGVGLQTWEAEEKKKSSWEKYKSKKTPKKKSKSSSWEKYKKSH